VSEPTDAKLVRNVGSACAAVVVLVTAAELATEMPSAETSAAPRNLVALLVSILMVKALPFADVRSGQGLRGAV
jgi:hypothetical protein